MCGRFTLTTPIEEVARAFGVDDVGGLVLAPRYNIAPTQPVVAVRPRAGDGGRELALLRWGLVPSWVRDPEDWPTLINARAETLRSRPAFREALLFRRCLIPADGFYEWRRARGGKQPYYLRSREEGLLAFAGLWERWTGTDEEPLETCTIVTTDANELVRPLHDRMPVILSAEAREAWMDPSVEEYEALELLLRPPPAEALVAYPVSRRVNSPRFDGRECIEPLAGEDEAAPGPQLEPPGRPDPSPGVEPPDGAAAPPTPETGGRGPASADEATGAEPARRPPARGGDEAPEAGTPGSEQLELL